MKAIYGKLNLFLISIFAVSIIFLNFTTIVASENILIQKNISVNSNETLLVEMISADVEIISWNKNEVEILVKGKESINDYMDFKILYENGIVKLISVKKSDWNSWGFSKDINVKVRVPKEFNLSVKTSGGDIETKMIVGDMKLKTSGGDIELKDSKGSLDAKTSGGDVEVREFDGDAILITSGGDIEAKQINGSIEAKTSGGDIELSVSNGEVIATTSGGDIELKYNGNNVGVELHTSGGSIDVVLPSNFAADVYLRTSGGSIRNDFSTKKLTEASKSKFVGKYNNGGASFKAKTSGGSISVKEK